MSVKRWVIQRDIDGKYWNWSGKGWSKNLHDAQLFDTKLTEVGGEKIIPVLVTIRPVKGKGGRR